MKVPPSGECDSETIDADNDVFMVKRGPLLNLGLPILQGSPSTPRYRFFLSTNLEHQKEYGRHDKLYLSAHIRVAFRMRIHRIVSYALFIGSPIQTNCFQALPHALPKRLHCITLGLFGAGGGVGRIPSSSTDR